MTAFSKHPWSLQQPTLPRSGLARVLFVTINQPQEIDYNFRKSPRLHHQSSQVVLTTPKIPWLLVLQGLPTELCGFAKSRFNCCAWHKPWGSWESRSHWPAYCSQIHNTSLVTYPNKICARNVQHKSSKWQPTNQFVQIKYRSLLQTENEQIHCAWQFQGLTMDLPVHTNADSSYYENAANFVSTNILVTLASSRSIPAVFHGSRKKPHVERRVLS